jgi:maltokinase
MSSTSWPAEPAVSPPPTIDAGRLSDWITAQRWFASKGRVGHIGVVDVMTLSDDPPLALALIEAQPLTDTGSGATELYQLHIGGEWAEGTSPDSMDDPEGRAALAELLLEGRRVNAGESAVEFHWSSDRSPRVAATARRLGAEQSNSSMLIDDKVVLKLFRRLQAGVNPELEMLRFLHHHGFSDVPQLVGWIELHSDALDATLAVAQTFVADGRDAWELTLDALEQGAGGSDDFRQLGAVVGAMHGVLGSDARQPAFAPEQPSEEWMSLLVVTIDRQIEELFASLPSMPALEPLAGRSDEVRAVLDSLSHGPSGGRLLRTHGDLHLGQVLRTPQGWIILDFEGEPARSLVDRRRKRSPLRDVASMLRSFAYAASAVRLQRRRDAPPGWEEQARRSFLVGYFDAVDPLLLPRDRTSVDRLLAVFELEKALYELSYEIHNRPDWVDIPVAAIRRILGEHTP